MEDSASMFDDLMLERRLREVGLTEPLAGETVVGLHFARFLFLKIFQFKVS